MKTDVYSFGVVLWELVSRRVPYGKVENWGEFVGEVGKGVRPDMEWISAKCPKVVKGLIERCWSRDPYARPDVKEIVQVLSEIRNEELNKSY